MRGQRSRAATPSGPPTCWPSRRSQQRIEEAAAMTDNRTSNAPTLRDIACSLADLGDIPECHRPRFYKGLVRIIKETRFLNEGRPRPYKASDLRWQNDRVAGAAQILRDELALLSGGNA